MIFIDSPACRVHLHYGYLKCNQCSFHQNPEQGARTVLYAAQTPQLEGRGGTYLSNCRLVQISSAAKNTALCEKFFKFTCELVNVKKFGQLNK